MEQISSIEEIIASAIDGIVIIYLMNSCFGKSNIQRNIYELICWIALFVTGHWLEEYVILQSIILILIIGGYCHLQLKERLVNGLITGVAINVGLALVNMVIIFLISILSGHPIGELIDERSLSRIVFLILSKLTFMLVGIMVVNKIAHFVKFKLYQWIYICVYYIATFIICALVSSLLVSVDFSNTDKIIMLIIVGLVVVLNIITYFIILHINNENKIETENKLLNIQIKNEHNMIKKTSELYEETRALRHDMRHYFTTFSEMIRNGNADIVLKEMSKVADGQLNNVDMINLNNPILNAAINDKLNLCHHNDIRVETLICGNIPEEMSMDMALVISNLMDNAIEAEIQQRERKIELIIQEQEESFLIEVRNHLEKPVIKKGEELVTHKKDKKRHGYGLKNVRKIINRYEGYFCVKEEGEKFVATLIISF